MTYKSCIDRRKTRQNTQSDGLILINRTQPDLLAHTQIYLEVQHLTQAEHLCNEKIHLDTWTSLCNKHE
jgi:hypothetical protein